MGAVEEGGKVAVTAVETLRSQPLALALVLINMLFLIVGSFILIRLSDAVTTRTAAMLTLIERCLPVVTPRG